MPGLVEAIASDRVMDEAYNWLSERRHTHPHNAEIWHLWVPWDLERGRIQRDLLDGTYCFSTVR